MDKKDFQRIPVSGIILVVLGVVLLLKQLNMIRISGPILLSTAFAIYGAVTVIRSFLLNVRKGIFWGALCFFGGSFFALIAYDFISHSPEVVLPGALLVFGFAFVTLFLYNFRDIHLLIPAILFVGLGVSLMMTRLGYWYMSDVWEAVERYWPLALVLFGASLLFRKKNS
jgi:hypothetical protein